MPNKLIISAAGAGKTELIVDVALVDATRRTLLTTYTQTNTAEIERRIHGRVGLIPHNIAVRSWYDFIVAHGVRPYLPHVTEHRIERIDWSWPQQGPRRSNVDRYFFIDGETLIGHRASDLTCFIDDLTDGLVVRRMARIFDQILIDEMQDLAGYDLDLLIRLMKSDTEVVAVGDPRQQTFVTNQSRKNRQFRAENLSRWIDHTAKTVPGTSVSVLDGCHRCNQEICDFADQLYPDLPASNSYNDHVSDHRGIHLVPASDVEQYYRSYAPMALRYSRNAKDYGLPARNFGEVKGQSFDRVLIVPTNPILNFLRTGNRDLAGDISKLYVAVTRARHSVAFVVPDSSFPSKFGVLWEPTG